MKPTVYLVIPTDHIGGAEKRFLRIWLELKRTTDIDVRLIVQEKLLNHTTQIKELSALEEYVGSINTSILTGDALSDLERLKVFADKLEDSSVFHYVLLPPVKKSSGHKYIYSFPSSDLSKSSPRGLASIFLGCLLADHIDVLSPSVIQFFQKLFFLRRNKFSLTPGSFVDFEQYSSAHFTERKDELVFLGLLSHEKQADRLLDCIPELDSMLKKSGHTAVQYRMLGRSAGDFQIKTPADNIDLQIGYDPQPELVLRHSKVFFSLQRADNYPSKSLLEAIACGNQVVVTDVGNSERIAPRSTSFYIPRNFSPSDLFTACSKVLDMNEEQFYVNTNTNMNFIKDNFSIKNSLKYFINLYQGG